VRLDNADNLDRLRTLEAHAAIAYWNAWRDVPLLWARSDLRRVPDHWRTFGTRASPLTGGPRLAVNPASALLNFIFAVCESEERLALSILGLDPGIGFLTSSTGKPRLIGLRHYGACTPRGRALVVSVAEYGAITPG
jgi:CRISPR/Cas system-associated endonuclease Cas1